MHDDDLSPDELAALRALPRERDPGDLLEHRTVRALRARNLLRQPERRGIVLSPAWLTAAAAVLLAVFTGGFAIGQWLEARQNDQTMIAMREHDAAQAAAMVQQTGSAYLAALSAFAEAFAPSDGVEARRRRLGGGGRRPSGSARAWICRILWRQGLGRRRWRAWRSLEKRDC